MMKREISLSEGALKTKDACSIPHGIPYGCTLSGAFAILSQVLDGVCILHGPIGCTHLNLANHWGTSLIRHERRSVGASERRRRNNHPTLPYPYAPNAPYAPTNPLSPRVISSCLGESEVIFGGEEALRKALCAAEQRFHPPLIAVVSSCVAGVIGDDVEGVIQGMEENIREKVLWVETDGFVSGGFDLGVNRAYRDLIENLVDPPRSQDQNLVNVLGEKALASDVETNFQEIEQLLGQLGVRVGMRFVRHATVEEIRRMGEASLNLISSRETGLYPARLLQEKYEMPFLWADFPVGQRETADWLRHLGRLLDREGLAEEIRQREEEAFLKQLDRYKKVLSGKRMVINTVDRQVDWLVDLAQSLEMEVVQINVFQLLKEAEAGYYPRNLGPIDPSIPICPVKGPGEIQVELERLRPHLCLGTSRLSLDLEGVTFQSIPMVPAVGYRGGVEMATRWYRTLKNPRWEGWKKRGTDLFTVFTVVCSLDEIEVGYGTCHEMQG